MIGYSDDHFGLDYGQLGPYLSFEELEDIRRARNEAFREIVSFFASLVRKIFKMKRS